MNRSSALGFVALVAVGAAVAQTPEEARFVEHLGAGLSRNDLTTEVPALGRGWDPVSAISVKVGAELRFDRLQFASAEDAQQFALFRFKDALQSQSASWKRLKLNPNITGEVRGDQVILIHGDAVADQTRARELRALAWAGLPGSGLPAEVAFGVDLQRRDGVLTTRLGEGPVHHALGQMPGRLRAGAQNGVGEVTDVEGGVEYVSERGTRGVVRAGEAGASLWATHDAGGRPRMEAWLAALNAGMTPSAADQERRSRIIDAVLAGIATSRRSEPQDEAQPAPENPLEGATQRLGNLLGR